MGVRRDGEQGRWRLVIRVENSVLGCRPARHRDLGLVPLKTF